MNPVYHKPHTPLKEQINTILSILQQSDPVRAHAKGKPRNFPGVIPVVLHKLEHIRVDHAASKNFNPSRLLARTARSIVRPAPPAAAADKARYVHLRARLSKRQKRWTKTRLHARSKKFLHRVIERPLQVAKRYAGISRPS